jgi:leader peptidase (prepilin peptidase) / N-methyltransferase
VFSLWLPPGPWGSLAGTLLGAGMLFVIRWVWFRATSVEGMGLGDVKMAGLIGAFLGPRQVWLVLLLASVGGAAVGITMALARGRSLHSRLAFGTFLAVAAFIASIVGDRIISWYLDLYV